MAERLQRLPIKIQENWNSKEDVIIRIDRMEEK